MKRLVLTRAAERDLKAIARYTQERWGVRQRNAHLKEIDQAFHALIEKSEAGRACDWVREGYRWLPHGRHMIYCKIVRDALLVVRILRVAMDVDFRLGESSRGCNVRGRVATDRRHGNATGRNIHLAVVAIIPSHDRPRHDAPGAPRAR